MTAGRNEWLGDDAFVRYARYTGIVANVRSSRFRSKKLQWRGEGR